MKWRRDPGEYWASKKGVKGIKNGGKEGGRKGEKYVGKKRQKGENKTFFSTCAVTPLAFKHKAWASLVRRQKCIFLRCLCHFYNNNLWN